MIQMWEKPFGAADFRGFTNHICKGTEQILQIISAGGFGG